MFKSLTAGRVVTILTPILFVPLAGIIVLQASKLGLDLPPDQTLSFLVEAGIFAIGALTAWMKSSTWLKAYRDWEVEQAKQFVPDPSVNSAEVIEAPKPTTDEEIEKLYAKLQAS